MDNSRLATKGRLVTKAVWLQEPLGYAGSLVTKAVWLQKLPGYNSTQVLNEKKSKMHIASTASLLKAVGPGAARQHVV